MSGPFPVEHAASICSLTLEGHLRNAEINIIFSTQCFSGIANDSDALGKSQVFPTVRSLIHQRAELRAAALAQ